MQQHDTYRLNADKRQVYTIHRVFRDGLIILKHIPSGDYIRVGRTTFDREFTKAELGEVIEMGSTTAPVLNSEEYSELHHNVITLPINLRARRSRRDLHEI